MRIKYKTPHNLFFRRFWFVKNYLVQKNHEGDAEILAHNALGRTIHIPLKGTIWMVIGNDL